MGMEKLASGKLGGAGWTRWSDWLEGLKAKGVDLKGVLGVYLITHVFPPNRYPQATLVFHVPGTNGEEEAFVKKSIPPQVWSSLAPLFPEGKAAKGFQLYISFAEGEYEILKEPTPDGVYAPRQSGGWELV